MNHLSSHNIENDNLIEKMKSNFVFSINNSPKEYKNYLKKNDLNNIYVESYWKSFLRNKLSLGINNNLNRLKIEDDNCDYTNLISKHVQNIDDQKDLITICNFLIKTCGEEFLLSNIMNDTGDPQILSCNIKSEDDTEIMFSSNYHDLGEIYYFYSLKDVINYLNSKGSPIFVELGGGYGGMVTKFKNNVPKGKFIIFDTPENNRIKEYYLTKNFKDSTIYTYKNYLNDNKILNKNFDFLILPIWEFKSFKNKKVDVVWAHETLLNLEKNELKNIFNNIHNTLKDEGLFAIIDYYSKVKNDNIIELQDLKFDKKWEVIFSQKSILQPKINIALLKRLKKPREIDLNKFFQS